MQEESNKKMALDGVDDISGVVENKYKTMYDKRAEILSKFTNGIEKYHTHALYQKVIDMLARGADPITIIEQLIDINIGQSNQLIKMYQHDPVSITLQESQVNEFLKHIKK